MAFEDFFHAFLDLDNSVIVAAILETSLAVEGIHLPIRATLSGAKVDHSLLGRALAQRGVLGPLQVVYCALVLGVVHLTNNFRIFYINLA